MGGPHRWVLVDAGVRGRHENFFHKLRRLNIEPRDIRLIVVTHVHFDHVGSLAAIQRRCDCPVAVHAAEAALLEKARIVLPPGTGVFSRRLIALAWWDWPHKTLGYALDDFRKLPVEQFLEKYEGEG